MCIRDRGIDTRGSRGILDDCRRLGALSARIWNFGRHHSDGLLTGGPTRWRRIHTRICLGPDRRCTVTHAEIVLLFLLGICLGDLSVSC